MKKTWDDAPDEGPREVARAVQWLVVTRLTGLAGDDAADPPRPTVPAAAGLARSPALDAPFAPSEPSDCAGLPRLATIEQEIRRFLNRPDPTHRRAEPPASPPGDPIGNGGW